MCARPTGTVTLLFTDIEGSTRLLRHLGERYAEALAAHRSILRAACAAHAGHEVDSQGDAFFVAFAAADEAVAAAVEMQAGLAGHHWPGDAAVRVRIGVHTGRPLPADEGYIGIDVHRGARICSAAHGGQILISASTREGLGAGIEARDLGEHQLKDLDAPERLFQVVADGLCEEFPALRSLGPRTNLPAAVVNVLGRAADVEACLAMLADEDTRVLTLTGPGGTGKTTVALELAAALEGRRRDGTLVVWLAPLRAADRVLAAIADTVGVRAASDQPLADALAERLRASEMLLVLDNVEHVLDATPAIAALLAACPGVSVLATSRVPLRIAGERQYRLNPLDVRDAVALFAERARDADARFTLTEENAVAVEEICRRLDCLPLALEIAAARIPMFPPAAMLVRLSDRLQFLSSRSRDAPERHRSLSAALSWSHELLGEPERTLLARMSVFAGGASLEAIRSVCGGSEWGVETLVEGSLAELETDAVGDPRVTMLETVREFGAEKLAERGEHLETRRRHALFFAELAERAYVGVLDMREQRWWLDRLEGDLDNVRVALERSFADGHAETALAIAGGLCWFWDLRDHHLEGRRFVERALEASEDADSLKRNRALFLAGDLAVNQGDWEMGGRRIQEAEAMARRRGDDRLLSLSLSYLAWRARILEPMGDSVRLGEEAVEVARRSGDLWLLGLVLNNSADALMEMGKFERSHAAIDESIALMRANDSPPALSFALLTLGQLTLAEGRQPAARSIFEEALGVARAADYGLARASVLAPLVALAVAEGDEARALELLAELLPLARLLHEPLASLSVLIALAAMLAERGDERGAAPLWGAAERSWKQAGRVERLVLEEIRARHLDPVMADPPPGWLERWHEGAAIAEDDALAAAAEALERLRAER